MRALHAVRSIAPGSAALFALARATRCTAGAADHDSTAAELAAPAW
jgi:hypothetical protein